jgi:hypothetical protein
MFENVEHGVVEALHDFDGGVVFRQNLRRVCRRQRESCEQKVKEYRELHRIYFYPFLSRVGRRFDL